MRFKLNRRDKINFALLAAVLGYFLIKYLVLPPDSSADSGYKWEWESLWQFFIRYEDGRMQAGMLLIGLFNTLRVSICAFMLATLLGFMFGCMRILPSLFARLSALSYVALLRNVPALVVVFVVHFFVFHVLEPYLDWASLQATLLALPVLSWLCPTGGDLGFFVSAVLALGLYEAAYISEIVRAGIESVPRGQWEAAKALGLPLRVQVVSIVLPQATRLMLPPMVSQVASLIKDSSIVSLIAVHELTFSGRQVIETTRMVYEGWISVALMYLVLCLLVSMLGAYLERQAGRTSVATHGF